MDIPEGGKFGKYQVLGKVGGGGMAVVLRALDPETRREVALKIILPSRQFDEKTRKRFLREVEAMSRLSHPGIMPVLDCGEQDGLLYYTMPLASGGTLKQRLERKDHPFAWREAVQVILPVAEALAYAHRQNVIHRDVKPSNIIYTGEGQPLLADFGVAKELGEQRGESLTSTGKGIGTPAYMALEQFRGGEIDGRADQYSLGVVLYEMITGRKPYEADTPAGMVSRLVNEPLADPTGLAPGLPGAVRDLLLKALAKEPGRRYANMEAFIQALRALDGGAAPAVRPAWKPTRRVWVAAALLTGAVCLLAAAVAAAATVAGLASNGSVLLAFLASPTPTVTLTPTATITPSPTVTFTPSPSFTPTVTLTPTPSLGIGSTITSEKDGMVLLYVPEGEFHYGDDRGVPQYVNVPEVLTLKAFWVDQTEVTNAMYHLCQDAGVCTEPTYKFPMRYPDMSVAAYYHNEKYANYPVVFVDQNQAAMYCEWAGRRLPLDAEWEKAARGPDGRMYPWGDEPISGERVNFADRNSPHDDGDDSVDDGSMLAAPVGSYPDGASPYGALDMSGNVWDFVSEGYIRGGAYNTNDFTVTTFFLFPKPPDETGDHIGFRCVMDAQP